jgi:hypothetical protein
MKEYECSVCGFNDEGALVLSGLIRTDQTYCLVCYEVLKTCPVGCLRVKGETAL